MAAIVPGAGRTSPKSFALTPETYYSAERPHVSVSQLNDYVRSPAWFWRRHVARTSPRQPMTPSMKLGSAVDSLLTGERMRFSVKALKRDDPEAYESQASMGEDDLISASVMEEAEKMASYAKSLGFWSEHSKRRAFQVILEGTIDKVLVCGKPDSLDIVGDVAFVDDIKVTGAAKANSAESWKRNCFQMGYFRQLAMYAELVKQRYPKVRRVICRHVVISKQAEDLYRVDLYSVSEGLVSEAMLEIREALAGIRAGKFDDRPVTWGCATHLSRQSLAPLASEDFEVEGFGDKEEAA